MDHFNELFKDQQLPVDLIKKIFEKNECEILPETLGRGYEINCKKCRQSISATYIYNLRGEYERNQETGAWIYTNMCMKKNIFKLLSEIIMHHTDKHSDIITNKLLLVKQEYEDKLLQMKTQYEAKEKELENQIKEYRSFLRY
jgi:hypothetical protein